MAPARRLSRGRARLVPPFRPMPNNAASVFLANRNHLTPTEAERLCYMAGSDFTSLWDHAIAAETRSDGKDYVSEVRAQLLAEDFLQSELDELENCIKEMRSGDRKDALLAKLKAVRDERDSAVQNMEYAVEQLDLLEKTLV